MDCKLKTSSSALFEDLRAMMTDRVEYIISNHARCNTLNELFVIAEDVHRTKAMVMWDLYFSASQEFRDAFTKTSVQQYFMKHADVEEALLYIANELEFVKIAPAAVAEPAIVEEKSKPSGRITAILGFVMTTLVLLYLTLAGKI